MIPYELLTAARIIHADVGARMRGRMGDPAIDNAAIVGCFAVMAGSGDYLEIGTLWGGSAMVVALLKKYFNIPGRVLCLDPLDGYHIREGQFIPNENMEAPVSLNTLLENAAIFGVEDLIVPIPKLSQPWPEELATARFSAAYIDGDHWGEYPRRDWEAVSPRTDRFVIFDNYEPKYPDVVRTCDELAHEANGWRMVYRTGITCVFARVEP